MKKTVDLDGVMNLPTPWYARVQEVGKEVYYGIADCHGVESFINVKEDSKSITMLEMRARANDQRHAVVYIATLNSQQVAQIKAQIKNHQHVRALLLLKTAERLYFLDDTRSARLWGNIPNPNLDPWG